MELRVRVVRDESGPIFDCEREYQVGKGARRRFSAFARSQDERYEHKRACWPEEQRPTVCTCGEEVSQVLDYELGYSVVLSRNEQKLLLDSGLVVALSDTGFSIEVGICGEPRSVKFCLTAKRFSRSYDGRRDLTIRTGCSHLLQGPLHTASIR